MEEKNLKFGQLHIIIQCILLAAVLLFSVDMNTLDFLPGVIALVLCTIIDFALISAIKADRTKLLLRVRIFELLVFSALCVFFPFNVASIQVVAYLIICVRMLEIIFLFDFTDSYARIISIGVMIFPLTIMILVELLLDQIQNPGNITSMGVVAMLSAIVIVVERLSDIFHGWISNIEMHMFEQRRLAENAKEMNETLRLHQEKIRKANEELGIQKIRMESANRLIQKANAEMNTQNELLAQLTTCHDVPAITKAIPEVLCKGLEKLIYCSIILVNENRHNELVFGMNTKTDIPEEFINAFREAACLEVMSDDKAVEIYLDKDINHECYNLIPRGVELQVVAVLPLFKKNKKVGIVYMGSNNKDYFDESTSMLENISTQLVLGLENIELYNEIQKMAITDGLTGLYNRRKLNEMLETFCSEAKESQVPLAVAMLDIDHFKIFNDTYGHACGDMVLKELAKILDKWSMEYGGVAARYGGEEFVMAFMNCDVERIEEILARTKREIDDSVYFYDGKRISIRVSMGYSAYPETTMNPNRILNNADAALYFSKEHGRNRITGDSAAVIQYMEEREKAGKK